MGVKTIWELCNNNNNNNNNNNFIHVSIIKIAVIKPLSKDTT